MKIGVPPRTTLQRILGAVVFAAVPSTLFNLRPLVSSTFQGGLRRVRCLRCGMLKSPNHGRCGRVLSFSRRCSFGVIEFAGCRVNLHTAAVDYGIMRRIAWPLYENTYLSGLVNESLMCECMPRSDVIKSHLALSPPGGGTNVSHMEKETTRDGFRRSNLEKLGWSMLAGLRSVAPSPRIENRNTERAPGNLK